MTLSSLSSGILVLIHEREACCLLAAALVPSGHNRATKPTTPQATLAAHLQAVSDAGLAIKTALRAPPGSKQAMQAVQAMLQLARSRLSCQVALLSFLLTRLAVHFDSSKQVNESRSFHGIDYLG